MSAQYLLMVEEGQKALLQALLGGNIQFLQVQGMGMQNNASCQVLVSPVIQPVTPMPVPQPVDVTVHNDVDRPLSNEYL